MFFSVICASRNEEDVIHLLIESFLRLSYKKKELIIIDDSTDNTKSIIQKYTTYKSVKLIHGLNHGCCEARNRGIKESIGDVIIFMTADSFFEKNFINEILPYYEKGYDAVMVNSLVSNRENIWADFIQSYHEEKLDNNKYYSPLTTQGYSVRKKIAFEVGLIDSGIYKPNICRDWTLIKKMDKKKYKKFFSKEIRCKHIAPDNFKEFSKTHFLRGQISAGYNIKFRKRNLILMTNVSFLKLLKYIFTNIILLKSPIKVYRSIKYSKLQSNSLFIKYLGLDLIKNYFFIYGEIKTYLFYFLKKF